MWARARAPGPKTKTAFTYNDAGEPILAATSKGIDVSKYQGQVDWEKAQANGVEFALIRCGFGSEWNGDGRLCPGRRILGI